MPGGTRWGIAADDRSSPLWSLQGDIPGNDTPHLAAVNCSSISTAEEKEKKKGSYGPKTRSIKGLINRHNARSMQELKWKMGTSLELVVLA